MSDLFGYPYLPARGKTDTSDDAAEQLHKPMTLKEKVYWTFECYPDGRTADEIAIELGKDGLGILSVRPRVTELVKTDMLVDTGKRRKNSSGRNAIVWRARL